MAEGWVRSQGHPTLPLRIFNYSEGAQYCNHWNDVTLNCRGLILDEDFNLIARPWKKFFNFGQRDLEIAWDAPVEVTDKLDGSLGILYPTPDGEYAIATRGSFTSDQALHATELLSTEYADFLVDRAGAHWLERTTYLFEIIYPANRIVLNYGDMDDLVLLGGVDNERGHYYGPMYAGAQIAWPGPIAEVLAYKTFKDAISAPDRGKEGIVIRSGTKMVKIKEADYISAHRIVTNLTPKFVWEQLKGGKTVKQICDGIPDEFYTYVEEMAKPIQEQVDKVTQECYTCFTNVLDEVGSNASRKQFALAAAKTKHRAATFSLLDGKSIKEYVWKLAKPREDALRPRNDEI